ncbi:hypothetical protein JZK55_15130 [Dissulfurispira thermophila]|uniref:Card1 CARF domain-containing protein n=2 Tax=root TaxID=1 RepID=A0A7G1H359_9BACT|nr:DUF1887 family CARF protein [Dissulfurispira thermophila]BCB96591.1 hypothetical protein JZK55_15130 [Dissulfurispira thermophila]
MIDNSHDSLFLIVGTNPLPNIVIADYFLKMFSHLREIYLFHSEERQDKNQKGTYSYAQNIEHILKARFSKRVLSIHTIPLSDISNAKEIFRDMDKHLRDSLKGDLKIHLNYTGGTKVMVTHIYRKVMEYLKERKIKKATSSYLDARTFRIVDDEEGPITSDLRREIKLTLDEIMSLHGFRKVNKDEDFRFTEGVKKFKELIEQECLHEFFKRYPRERFLNKKNQLCEKKGEVRDELKSMNAEEPFLSVVLALPEDYRIFNPDGSFREPLTNKHLEYALKFIDGRWLEQYVYDILKSHFSDLNVYSNYEIRKSDWSGNQKFELDVIVVKGYQLIGISCTTSCERHVCKSKGFEILHRTRQIGGDEARTVLITMLNNDKRDELDDELSIDTGGKDNILVLGENDLKQERLVEKIKKFIE